MPIHQLFPEPVYISKLERVLTDTESKTIQQYKKKTYKNVGNTTSIDSYVLENLWLKNLKEDLTKKLKDYFDKIICTTWFTYFHISGIHFIFMSKYFVYYNWSF